MPNATVLLADDDELFRHTLRDELVIEGYDVIEAANGTETLEALAAAADGAAARPDVVVLDLRMPGCSGLGILEAARTFEHKPPMVLLTGFKDSSVGVLARRLGARYVLEKPVALADVLSTIVDAIGRS